MAVHAGRALFEQGIGDRRGNAQRGVLVWVYDRGTTTLATLYTDRTKATEADNPISTNGLGNLAIFADPGDYEAHVDSTGAVLYFSVLPDWEDVVTEDQATTVNMRDHGAVPGGPDCSPAFNAAVAECFTTGKRRIVFPGGGSSTEDSNYRLLTDITPIPAMPPVHDGGPPEPLYLEGDGYGNTQIAGTENIPTLTPLIARGIQFRVNVMVQGPVAGPTNYPHRFIHCGLTDSALFCSVDTTAFFDMCALRVAGHGPMIAFDDGVTLSMTATGCEMDVAYGASSVAGAYSAHVNIVGGTSGLGGIPFLAPVDASGTLLSESIVGVRGIPTEWGFPCTRPHTVQTAFVPMVDANYTEFMRVKGSGLISKIGLYVGTSSGNISVGVCRGPAGRANPTTRVATSGPVACPAPGWQEVALTTEVYVRDGDWFALSADNATATFFADTSHTLSPENMGLGIAAFVAGHPIASPLVGLAPARNVSIQLVGVA